MKRLNLTALISALTLTVLGILNFFITFPYDVNFGVMQSVVHIATGVFGVLMIRRPKNYLLGLGIGGSLLSVLGFIGMHTLLGVIDLSTYVTYVYAAIGIAGVFAYLDEQSRTPKKAVS